MSFFKKLAKTCNENINFVGSSIELDSLKKERTRLNEKYDEVKKERELFLKYKEEKDDLATIVLNNNNIKAKYVNKLSALISTADDDLIIKNAYISIVDEHTASNQKLTAILEELNNTSNMNDQKFEQETQQFENESERIKARLEVVRKVIH